VNADEVREQALLAVKLLLAADSVCTVAVCLSLFILTGFKKTWFFFNHGFFLKPNPVGFGFFAGFFKFQCVV